MIKQNLVSRFIFEYRRFRDVLELFKGENSNIRFFMSMSMCIFIRNRQKMGVAGAANFRSSWNLKFFLVLSWPIEQLINIDS